MSPRQLATIAIGFGVLLLLWGAAAFIRTRPAEASSSAALPVVPRAAVESVTIAGPQDTAVMVRQDSTTWTVNGHPAAEGAVADLLQALADSTRQAEVVAERAASHARLGVDSSAATHVRIASRESEPVAFLMGERSPGLDGAYFRQAGDSTVYLVRGRLAELLERGADEWRDRRMGGIPPDSVSGIEVARGRRSYTLRRSDGKWTFSGSGAAADSAAVIGLLGAYREIEASGFASAAQADSARFAPADRRVRLLGADGAPRLTLALDSTAGGFWARVDSGTVVYRLESWTADRLTPADSTLRKK